MSTGNAAMDIQISKHIIFQFLGLNIKMHTIAVEKKKTGCIC